MAGHSKWAQIKYKKAVTDAKKSKIFSKISALITVAARTGGPNPESNPSLREVIEKARALNLPQENIERAIKRGSGQLAGASLEPVTYEAYGPGGIATVIMAITDNKNRTLAEIREIVSRHGGKLAQAGSVLWLFREMGLLAVPGEKWTENLELQLIDVGAEEIKNKGNDKIVFVSPLRLGKAQTLLSNAGIYAESRMEFLPENPVVITDPVVKKSLASFFQELDDHIDVTEIYSNVSEG